MAGLYIISFNGAIRVNKGDILTFIGAAGFALYLLNVEKQSAKSNILSTIVAMFAFCTIAEFGLALYEAPGSWLPQQAPFWTGIIYCALFSTAYMYTVSNLSQKYIKAEQVAIIYLFEPVFAALAIYCLLGEHISYRVIVGGSFIFTAAIISEIKLKGKNITALKLLARQVIRYK